MKHIFNVPTQKLIKLPLEGLPSKSFFFKYFFLRQIARVFGLNSVSYSIDLLC